MSSENCPVEEEVSTGLFLVFGEHNGNLLNYSSSSPAMSAYISTISPTSSVVSVIPT